MPASLAIRSMDRLPEVAHVGPALTLQGDGRASFEVYRAEEVSVTSSLFSGGDWRWRLRSAAGAVLANGNGYKSERSCRTAVNALRSFAGSARDEQRGDCR
jgi:uncharacterized protein YegP (UPF0339 family)